MASSRNVSVTLSAKIDRFKADMAAAGKAARDAAQSTETHWDKSNASLGRMVGSAERYSSELTTAGSAMAAFGGVVVGALGLSAKAAVSWESAWAGVTKTVDGTPKQLAAVEEGLRGLARTMPESHEQIAAVAEAAGQLGVKTESIVSFTKTMVQLGDTTNLTAEEAATAIAQITNVMGTSAKDVGRFGAALVELGNNGASTEKDILNMAQRLAGAGKLVGATESDILALANAMSSVGIEAQLGGGVLSRVMQRMYSDVQTGSDGLEGLAEVAGVSAEEFARAFEEDPVRAVAMITDGLNRVKESGGNVVETMSELGIKGTEETSVMLQLAGAGDLLTDSLDMGADAWEKNTALAEEAAKRYETAESKIQIAGNSLKDTAITIGGTFLPIIASVAEVAADIATGMGKVPEPVMRVGAVLAALAGAAGLAGGAVLILAPKIAETVTAFSTLREAAGKSNGVIGKVADVAGRSSGVMGKVTKAVGLMAAGFIAAQIAGEALGAMMDTSSRSAAEMRNRIAQLGEVASADVKGGLLDPAIWEEANGFWVKGIGTEAIDSWGDALERSGDKASGWLDSLLNVRSDVTIVNETISETDEALKSFAESGSFEQAAAGFKAIAEQSPDMLPEDVLKKFPQFRDYLTEVATQAGMTADDATLVGLAMGTIEYPAEAATEAIGGVGGAAGDAASSLKEMLDGLLALGIIQQSEMEAMDAYAEAVDGISAAVEENGRTFDQNTEAGRANRDAFYQIANAGRDAANAMAENGASQDEVQKQLKQTYDDLVDAGKAFGLTGDEAKDLARKVLGVPDGVSIKTWMSDAAKKSATDLKKILKDLDGTTVNTFVKVNETYIRKEQGEATYTRDRYGNIPKARARGSIDIRPMASGGLLDVAEVVRPGDFRLVGDASVDEAFIPLDGSPRSMKILMEAIQRMPGFGGAMAEGGVVGSSESPDSVGGIPVPDTTPITDAWQAMFDTMLATTVAGWAAQVTQQATSQATMLTAAQSHSASSLSIVQGQWAAMNGAVLAAMTLQHQQVLTGYQSQQNVMTQILSAMSSVVSDRWSGMSQSQAAHLDVMRGTAAAGFSAIRSGGEQQMSALSSAVGREMGDIPPETRSALQDTAGVLNRFSKAVNEAFGEIGVKLPSVPAFRDGGPISGPGTGTSDSILARVSNGEFIMPADKTASYYPILEAMRSGDYPAYASGGMVALQAAARWLQGKGARITEFGAWGQPVGGHAPGSYHYKAPGQAFDANYGPGGQNATEMSFFDKVVPMIHAMWPGLRSLWRVAGHFNHLHLDTGGSGGSGGALSGLLGALNGSMPGDLGDAYAKAAKIKGGELKDKFSKQLPDNLLAGQMGAAVMSMMVSNLEKQAREYGDTFIEGAADTSNVANGPVKQMARAMLEQMGWGDQWPDLNWLLTRESGWRPTAQNPSSTAYGLFQFLDSTWSTVGGHKTSDPKMQLAYGLKYIKQRYGDVRGARAFWERNHWYASGTDSAAPGWAWVGEEGPELVNFGGGEQVIPHRESMAVQDRMLIPNSPASSSAAPAVNVAGLSPDDLAAALDGVRLTFQADGQQFSGAVTAVVGNGYDQSRSRLSKSSQKIGAR